MIIFPGYGVQDMVVWGYGVWKLGGMWYEGIGHGNMGVWWYGCMGIWWYGDMGMVVQRYGGMRLWWFDGMGVWWYGGMGVWRYGGMAVWVYIINIENYNMYLENYNICDPPNT